MKTMQKNVVSNRILLLLAVSMLLSLMVAVSLSFTLQETAFANGDADKLLHNDISQLEINSIKNIDLASESFIYVDFFCESETTYIYSIKGNKGKVATKVLTYDKSEEFKPTLLYPTVFSIDLEKGKTYKIGFQSTEKENLQVCINKAENAFQWIINDEIITNKAINLIRGKMYSVDFAINGNIYNAKLLSSDKGKYNYNFDYNMLNIKSNCAIEGKGFVLQAINNSICLDELTIIPKFNQEIKIEGTFDKGSERGLYFVYQKGITKINYTVEYLNKLIKGNINTVGDTAIVDLDDGQVYELNVIDTLNSIEGKQGNAKVTITGAEVQTADNTLIDHAVKEKGDVVPLRLTWSGSGTESNPYLVTSTAHFNDIDSKDGSGVHFKQQVNLNFGESATTRNVNFKGIYNGNNKEITNIFMGAGSSTPFYDGGLFDRNEGIIKNIAKYTVEMNYTHMGYVGGMVGKNEGTIETPYTYNAYLTFIASGTSYSIVGGVAGQNNASGDIILKNSIYVNIISHGSIGGVIGENMGYLWEDSSNIVYLNGRIEFTYKNSSYDDVGGFTAINNGGTINRVRNSVITIILNNLDFRISNNNNSSTSIQPRVGASVGTQKNQGIIYFANHGGNSYLNLYSYQRIYVSFSGTYIGEIVS